MKLSDLPYSYRQRLREFLELCLEADVARYKLKHGDDAIVPLIAKVGHMDIDEALAGRPYDAQ